VIQDHMGARKFPAAMKQVALEADRQHHDHGDQAAMFQREKVTPAEAIRHAFKLAGPKKSTAPAEESAPKPRKPRTKKPAVAPETAPEAPGPGWETPRRTEGSAVATPASEPSEAVLAAQAAANQRDDRTLGMFMALPPATWRKADDGLGRFVMHAITWEAKNLVRAAVGAAKPGGGIDGARVLKRLHQFVQEQTREDREFARAIGAHPVSDATLRGLVQAAAHAHVSHLAKSLAVGSLWIGWCKAVNA